jgi:excisionase family DNA binding protein
MQNSISNLGPSVFAPSGGGDHVSVTEAAARAKMGTRTIFKWIQDGTIPAFGRGRITRVRMADVLAPKTRNPR